ncbi:MAG: hypothetical protein AAF985_23220 [Bacteroidota bacterium]
MSGKKLKMTGFALFFLAMLIIAPLSFLGASYYNGQDGIQNLKELLGLTEPSAQIERSVEEKPIATQPSKEYVNSQIKKLEDDLSEKEARVEKLYLENEELKKQLADKDQEINEVQKKYDSLKKKLDQIKNLDLEN